MPRRVRGRDPIRTEQRKLASGGERATRPVGDRRRLQVGRDERSGLEIDPWWLDDDCGYDCPCCDWGHDEEDDGGLLLSVANLVASLYRPFENLCPAVGTSP